MYNLENMESVVIAGMAKTGTTLPLTLLDGHPELTVFPEEVRFFHHSVDAANADEAANALLNDGNINQLKLKNTFFDKDQYMDHGGSGFGKRDYSAFNFDIFKNHIKRNFENSDTPEDRYLKIVEAFLTASGANKLVNKNLKFVSKAPHNEKFIHKWEDMLSEKVKYILCTRVPTEHYLSLKNVNKMRSHPRPFSCYRYVKSVKERVSIWSKFPSDRTYILDYDSLLREPQMVMREISEFLNIEYSESLLNPTKFGVKWSGNSSRGIVKNKIFSNDHKAEKFLQDKEIQAIEYLLKDFYEDNGWDKILKHPKSSRKFIHTNYYLLNKLQSETKKLTRNAISTITPNTVKASIKKLIS